MDQAPPATFGGDRRPPPSRWPRPRLILLGLDIISLGLSFLAAELLFRVRPQSVHLAQVGIIVGIGLVGALTLILIARDGRYSLDRRMSRLSDIWNLTKNLILASALVTLFGLATKGFFTGFTNPSRLVVFGSVGVFYCAAMGARLVLWAYQRHLFARGEGLRTVLVLGDGETARDFLDFLESRPWLGVVCAGRLTLGPSSPPGASADRPCARFIHLSLTMEGLEQLHHALQQTGATEVVVAVDPEDCAPLPEITRLLTIAHVPFRVVPSLFEESYRSTTTTVYDGVPVIDVEVDPLDRVERGLKRLLDLVVAGTALILGLLPMLAISLAIVVETGTPVFFRQERVGRNGKHFQMLKFRTMVKNAEELRGDLESQDETGSSGQMFKMARDPRVTRVGAFLRKWSLDEFPQFLNVVRGDMSAVGPRPPLPREVDNYLPEHLGRLKAMPGITGLWQVSGRSNLTFDDMVRLDRYYIENWSLQMDLSILVRTVVAVLTRKGAV